MRKRNAQPGGKIGGEFPRHAAGEKISHSPCRGRIGGGEQPASRKHHPGDGTTYARYELSPMHVVPSNRFESNV